MSKKAKGMSESLKKAQKKYDQKRLVKRVTFNRESEKDLVSFIESISDEENDEQGRKVEGFSTLIKQLLKNEIERRSSKPAPGERDKKTIDWVTEETSSNDGEIEDAAIVLDKNNKALTVLNDYKENGTLIMSDELHMKFLRLIHSGMVYATPITEIQDLIESVENIPDCRIEIFVEKDPALHDYEQYLLKVNYFVKNVQLNDWIAVMFCNKKLEYVAYHWHQTKENSKKTLIKEPLFVAPNFLKGKKK